MKTVFQNLKKTDWLLAAVCLAFIALQVWLDLKTPDYMAEITTLVQTAGSTMGAASPPPASSPAPPTT